MATFLTGKKVILRTLAHDDITAITRWINDPHITQFLNAYRPMMEDEEEKWYQSLVGSTTDFVFAIEANNENHSFIGIMGIHGVDHRNQIASTGALIGDTTYHGKGYGTDAKMHLLHWAFNELNLRKITSSVLASNHRSKKYLEKTGYVVIGARKYHHLVDGNFIDEILMEVFRKDFMKTWNEYSGCSAV